MLRIPRRDKKGMSEKNDQSDESYRYYRYIGG